MRETAAEIESRLDMDAVKKPPPSAWDREQVADPRQLHGFAGGKGEALSRELEDDETLLVQSGKPVGVFRTHEWAPRVLIANSNLVPDWATWPEFRRLEHLGLTMYGQMTAGSWIYIGTQGILQGTYETFAAIADKRFGGSLAGTITLTAGLGGMGGAQPLAVTMNGGVGLIVCQWAKHLGATVIGTVGSEEKAELARSHGCHHTILYNQQDFAKRVREITDGKGVNVVYDSVGQATFIKSLDCLRPMGMMASFGQSSGLVTAFDPGLLAAKGSLFLTRPSLMTYTAERDALLAHARDLFEVVQSGAVKIEVRQTYPLSEAARAHQDLEARKTTGSTILIPGK